MSTKVVKHTRVLWMWCLGHQRHEIAAIERHVGSEEFERMMLKLWGADVPYHVTQENFAFGTLEQPWGHA